MKPTRRQYVLGVGVAVAGIGAGQTVLGETHPDALVFEEVNEEGEYAVIRNTGTDPVDLSGYYMEFELGQQESQTRQFPEGTTIEPNGTLKVASGAAPVEDADVTFNYERGEIRNDGSDTLAILEPDEETVVIRSDEDFVEDTPTPTEAPEDGDDGDGGQPTASVTFEDQTTDGSSVEVASVTMSDGGFVTIHDSSLLDGAVLDSVVGVSETLGAGAHEGIEVTLFEGVPGAEFDQDALQQDETLIAMPHFDSNDNGTYDFVTSEGEEDGPYTDAEGAITDDATVTVEDEAPSRERFVAELSGEGHGIDTQASGRAEFEVAADAEGVHYTLEVEELCDATMAHIHLGGEGEDGPIVVWLYPTDQQQPRTKDGRFTGTLADGTFTADDFVGPLEGQSLDDLRAAHAEQGAYVNVHTEDHPGGEIRGQIEPAE